MSQPHNFETDTSLETTMFATGFRQLAEDIATCLFDEDLNTVVRFVGATARTNPGLAHELGWTLTQSQSPEVRLALAESVDDLVEHHPDIGQFIGAILMTDEDYDVREAAGDSLWRTRENGVPVTDPTDAGTPSASDHASETVDPEPPTAA